MSKVNVYVGDDGTLHFVNGSGADTVIPFSNTSIPELIASSIASHTARTFDVSSRPLHLKYTTDNFYLVAKGLGYGRSSELNNVLDKSYNPDTGILSVTKAVNHYSATDGFWIIYDVYLIDSVLWEQISGYYLGN